MKLKISHSVIHLWQRGDIDGVINALQGKWQPATPAMEFGTEMHKEWEREVQRTGCLPEIFGGGKLNMPITESYKKVKILDWLWLSGIVDLQYGESGEVIVDYKTGKGSANQYGSSLQPGCYKVLHPEAKMFRYLCWNQHTNTVTSSMIHLTDEMYQRSLDQIITIACDIRDLLEKSGMENFNNVDK